MTHPKNRLGHAVLAATIGDLKAQIRNTMWLEVKCVPCGRTALVPPSMLPAKIPNDLPLNLAAAHFRCSECGGKHLTSRAYDQSKAKGYAVRP